MQTTVLVMLALCASCGCDGIIRNDFQTPDVDGNYKWAIQTEEGIFHEQRGRLRDVGGAPVIVVEGQYQYTAPDGQVINVLYYADETGFHATGPHIPTQPSIDIRMNIK